MAFGGGSRDYVSRFPHDKGGVELFRGRNVRQSWLPTSAPDVELVSENRNLFMDNLRLWDCLSLVRSDPTMTCQNAINLVFSLRDEEYFRSFPDTRHLMYLKFPSGVISHTDLKEASLENTRLKDENARLHAAVWVLRDNPNLQADTTVAAVFRLDDTQFCSKFPADYDTGGLRSSGGHSSGSFEYQNNNKTRRRSFRSTLDLGGPDMAIQLTNRPLRVGNSSRRCRSTSARPHQRAFYTMQPSRKLSVEGLCGCDFTSNCNWRSSVCWEAEHVPQSHTFSPRPPSGAPGQRWQRIQYRHIPCVQPLDDQVQEKILAARGRHLSSTPESGYSHNGHESKRSNTISGMDDKDAKPVKDNPSTATPMKCVPFSKPLPLYKNQNSPNSIGSFPFEDTSNISMISPCYTRLSKELHPKLNSLMSTHRLPGVVKNNNFISENKDNTQAASGSDEYLEKVKESNKTNERDMQISLQRPTLDARKLIENPKLLETLSRGIDLSDTNCSRNVGNPKPLNKSTNNDEDDSENSEGKKKRLSDRKNRPLSASSRGYLSTRLKNVNSTLRWMGERKSFMSDRFSNKSTEKSRKNTGDIKTRVAQVSSFIDTVHMSDSEKAKINTFLPDKGGFPPRPDSLPRASLESNKAPEIYLSSEPAPPSLQSPQQYPIKSYPTVKHFLDRQRRLMGFPFFKKGVVFFTREITPSVENLLHSDYARWKRDRTALDHDDTLKPLPGHHRKSSHYKRHLETWPSKKWRPSPLFERISSTQSHKSIKTPGSLKNCNKDSKCPKSKAIETLREMGNFKYTQPLVDMLQRKSCDQWKPPVRYRPPNPVDSTSGKLTVLRQVPILENSSCGTECDCGSNFFV